MAFALAFNQETFSVTVKLCVIFVKDRLKLYKGSAGKINTELTILLSTVCASHSAAPPILEYAETRSSGRLQMSTNQNAHLKVQNTKEINLTIYIGYE